MDINNKKGFTLIELLAVIVVLAIVTVLATRSILPFLANAARDSFAIEANEVITSASDAMSLITIGTVTDNYTYKDGVYCFTLQNLKDLGLWNKDDSDYVGTIRVTIENKTAYIYDLHMKNDAYYVMTDNKSIIDGEADVYEIAGLDETKFVESC